MRSVIAVNFIARRLVLPDRAFCQRVVQNVRPPDAIGGNAPPYGRLGRQSNHSLASRDVRPAYDRKSLADFPYIWTAGGWLFVAVALDLYSRRIVGWLLRPEMNVQLVIDAPVIAVWREGMPEELLHHSDQASQYTSEAFQRFLSAHGITCSMSRHGDC